MALDCKRDPCPARLPSHMEYTTPDVSLRTGTHAVLSPQPHILPSCCALVALLLGLPHWTPRLPHTAAPTR
ncbi:hypothetical protein IG631_07869 [Alternaria alternata]|nr:hypothetical protein IG631_07869 [Alternaria alternata]